mgnify:CR=1 FL=1
MKRVAYVSTDPGVPVFGSKGASVHVQAVVRELLRRGTEVHLVTARLGGDLPRGLGGVVVHELPRITGTPGREREESARRSARAAADVLARVHSDTPLDLVMERYSLWSDAAMTWARACDVPGVLEVNSPLVDEQAQHRVLADRVGAEAIARRAFDAADRNVREGVPILEAQSYGAFLSEHVREMAVRRYLPQEWPQDLVAAFASLTVRDLVQDRSGLPSELLDRSFVDLVADFYRFRNGHRAAVERMPAERLAGYHRLAERLADGGAASGEHRDRLVLFGRMLRAYLHGEEAG